MGKIKKLNEDDARMAYYSIRERIAFEMLAKELNLKITHTSDIEGYESWDVCYNTPQQDKYISEIKLRYRTSEDFEDCIFEKRKYDFLKAMCKTPKALLNELQPMFIVFYKDKVCVWDVNNIKETDFNSQFLRAQSVGGNLTKKDKVVTNLLITNTQQQFDFQLDFDLVNEKAKTIFEYLYPNTPLIF